MTGVRLLLNILLHLHISDSRTYMLHGLKGSVTIIRTS